MASTRTVSCLRSVLRPAWESAGDATAGNLRRHGPSSTLHAPAARVSLRAFHGVARYRSTPGADGGLLAHRLQPAWPGRLSRSRSFWRCAPADADTDRGLRGSRRTVAARRADFPADA